MGIAKAGETYWEVLDHSSERTADLSPLNAGTASVLDEHDGSKQVGNVKRAMLGPDKTGRAAMEFDGLTELSKARFEQMRSGKRPFVSFGYDKTGFNGDVDLGNSGTRRKFHSAPVQTERFFNLHAPILAGGLGHPLSRVQSFCEIIGGPSNQRQARPEPWICAKARLKKRSTDQSNSAAKPSKCCLPCSG